MIYLLFIILLLMLILNYEIYKNILMPSFVLILSFTLVTFVYVMCLGVINEPISVDTFLIIFGAIFLYWIGEVVAIGIKNKGKLARGYIIKIPDENLMMSMRLFVVMGLSIIILISSYVRFSVLCSAVGTSSSISSFLASYAKIRFYTIHGMTPSFPAWVSMMTVIVPCIVKISITVFTYNLLRYGVIQKRYFLVFGSYVIYSVTSTSRTVYLELLVYIVVQFFFLRVFIAGKQPIINWQTIRPTIIAVIVFGGMFLIIGNLADKNGDLIKTLFGYSAAGIVGLNQYLEKPFYSPGLLYSRTINGVFSPLDNFGITIPEIEQFLPHFWYLGGTETSNEYTSLMEPIYDFGIGGMFITRFLLGIIIALIFYLITKRSNNIRKYFVIPMFVPIYYALAISAIDDQFSTFIGMYYLYQVIFTWIIWKVFIKYYYVE